MSPIPSLAPFRTALESIMDSTATIQRPTKTRDTTGGWTTSLTTVATLPCFYSPMMITPREQETTTAVKAISFWTFIFPAGSDVRNTDRIQVGGRTWEVVGGAERTLNIRLTVTAMEIQ